MNNKVTEELVKEKVQISKKTEEAMEDDGTSTRMDNPRKVLFEKDNPVASKGKKKSKLKKKRIMMSLNSERRLKKMLRSRKSKHLCI